MLSRRSILAAGAVALAAPSGLRAADAPLRFGVVADPQYADAPPNLTMGRFYAGALDKLRAAVDTFNGQELAFVITLGDVIDRTWESYDAILPIYERLRHRRVFLLGNHDFQIGAEHLAAVPARLGMPGPHYDFAEGGIRFVVLNGNDVSLFAPPPGDPRQPLAQDHLDRLKAEGAVNAQPWNGGLSDGQFRWLETTLEAARARSERVIVLNHYPVYPANAHNLWDCERVVALLAGHPQVVAYLNGHNHAGNYGETGGTHFVNFHGMVDTPSDNAYAVVEVAGDRMEIRGFGREPSRTLILKAA